MSFVQTPAIAALLSFVAPGLGQLSLGALRRGVLVALPAVGVLVAAVGLRLAGGGALLDFLLQPKILVGLLVLNVLLAGYHVLAIVDAYGLAVRARPTPPRAGRASLLVLAALLVGTFSLHGAIEAIGYQAYATLDRIFVPSEPDGSWSIPEPSFEPEPTTTASPWPSSPPSPTPTPSPFVTASPSPRAAPKWAAEGRLNLLLIGSDAPSPATWTPWPCCRRYRASSKSPRTISGQPCPGPRFARWPSSRLARTLATSGPCSSYRRAIRRIWIRPRSPRSGVSSAPHSMVRAAIHLRVPSLRRRRVRSREPTGIPVHNIWLWRPRTGGSNLKGEPLVVRSGPARSVADAGHRDIGETPWSE